MNPQDSYQEPVTTRVDNSLSVTQPGERTICTMKRHPIGIVSIYLMMGLVLVVIAVLAFAVAPSILSSSNSSNQVTTFGAVLFLLVAIFCAVFTMIATKVYWGNTWILTTDSITQISQRSLFKRESSQLSLGSIEDVTAEQDGVLPHMFNYGVLKAETAGKRAKFVFLYCPNPNFFAKQVLEAREAFDQGVESRGRMPQSENNGGGVDINTGGSQPPVES